MTPDMWDKGAGADSQQVSPVTGKPLTNVDDYIGGGSHYWLLKDEDTGQMYHYDTYRFKLEPCEAKKD